MRLMSMLLALVVPLPAVAQGEWDTFSAEGWQGARVCPFGEISEGGYFCLELACPQGGPLGFRIRLTEAEVQPVVEGMWTVDRREAGEILMAPLAGAPGQYYAPYDAGRDARLIERMLEGSEGSFTIVNRPIRAVRPFTLEGSFGPLSLAMRECPLEMPLEEISKGPAPDDVIEVVPADPEEIILVVPADPPEEAPAAILEDFGAEGFPEPDAEALADPSSDAAPETVSQAAPVAEADPAAEDPELPPGPLVAEDGSVSDPAALVLQEIEAACVARGGAFVEVMDNFIRRSDFDGDGIEDMEVSYSAAVCDAAAGLYCDTASCLTRVYLGREDGRFVPAFEDVYMSARTAPAFVVTYDAGSPACPEAEEPCEKVYMWRDGALVPVEAPQP